MYKSWNKSWNNNRTEKGISLQGNYNVTPGVAKVQVRHEKCTIWGQMDMKHATGFQMWNDSSTNTSSSSSAAFLCFKMEIVRAAARNMETYWFRYTVNTHIPPLTPGIVWIYWVTVFDLFLTVSASQGLNHYLFPLGFYIHARAWDIQPCFWKNLHVIQL